MKILANEKAKEAESRKAEEEKKPAPKQEQQTAVKETTPAPEKKETPPPTATDSDEYLYKAAMAFQQQGNYNEAINRYKKLESVSVRKKRISCPFSVALICIPPAICGSRVEEG